MSSTLSNNKSKSKSKSKISVKSESDSDSDSGSGSDSDQEYVGLKASQYDKITQREQIILRPDMHIGPVNSEEREDEWIVSTLDREKLKSGDFSFVRVNIMTPYGLERLYLEVLSNAFDNAIRSRKNNVEPGIIDIEMDDKRITITNGGVPLIVKKHKVHQMYVPEMVFGDLNSSSNYSTDETETAGKNGAGVKLVSIFSVESEVMSKDPQMKKQFHQIYRNNLSEKSEPEVDDYNGIETVVKFSWIADFKRFGRTQYDEYDQKLFLRHAIDTSFNNKLVVKFNGIKYNYGDPKKYVPLCFGASARFSAFYEYDDPDLPNKFQKNIKPKTELIIVDSPINPAMISFANGLPTINGGVHVESACKTISDGILNIMTPKERKQKKSSRKEAAVKEGVKKKKGIKLTLKDVRPKLSFILNTWVKGPKHESQTKTKLTHPKPIYKIPDNIFNTISKDQWTILTKLEEVIAMRQFIQNRKTNGKKTRFIGIEKVVDANWAGTDKFKDAFLCITEGKSGAGYPTELRNLMADGNDRLGIFPAKGKMLNVRKASREKLLEEDSEYAYLKKTLGLTDGMDYTIDENFETLRYGSVMIMADADDDGKHIIGLIINLFHFKFPSLLKIGYVNIYRTPVIRVQRGKEKIKFYSVEQYRIWAKKHKGEKWSAPDYFKGLGSTEPQSIKEDFKNPRIVGCVFDDLTDEKMEMAFDKRFILKRKEWIANYRRTMDIEDMIKVNISDFIVEELVQYSEVAVQRAVPKYIDGLKPSQRKILWTAICEKGKKGNKKIAMFDLVNKAVTRTKYRYGQQSLVMATTNMTQDFVGANNMRYIEPKSLLGHRYYGGDDAAQARYAKVQLESWVSKMFPEVEYPLYEYAMEEDKKTEPITLVPILPMVLINGSKGVGTAHSTEIPNHNPLDVANWIRCRLLDLPLPTFKPWYRGFRGNIELYAKFPDGSKKRVLEDGSYEACFDNKQEEEDEEVKGKKGGRIRIVRQDKDNDTDSEDDATEKKEDDDESEDDDLDKQEDSEDEEKSKPSRGESLGIEALNRLVGESAVRKIALKAVSAGILEDAGKDLVIRELPVGRWTHDYINILKNKLKNKEIKDFDDQSKEDNIKITIKGSKTASVKQLGLLKNLPMTNMVLLDYEHKPKRYDTVTEIMEDFYVFRLQFYEKRKAYQLNSFAEQIRKLEAKLRFIALISDNKIEIFKKTKSEIRQQLRKNKFEEEYDNYLLNTKTYSFTKEDIANLEVKISKIKKERDELSDLEVKKIWMSELMEFMRHYSSRYKENIPKEWGLKKKINITSPEKEKEMKKKKKTGKNKKFYDNESDNEESGSDDEKE